MTIPLGLYGAARPVASGGGSVSVEYLNFYVATNNTTTYTFTAVPLGDAAADRVVIVAISTDTGLNHGNVTGVTIGGVTATLDVSTFNAGTTAAIAHATVPTGTTGDVVVTYGGPRQKCGLGVFVAYGDVAVAGVDSSVTNGEELAIPGGTVVAAATSSSVSGNTVTWTGATQDFITNMEFSQSRFAAARGSGSVTPTWATTATTHAAVAVAFEGA